MQEATRDVAVELVRGADQSAAADVVAVEEPLELRAVAGGEEARVSVTMRTPGHDFELVAGFFFAEGIISTKDDIASMRHSGSTSGEGAFRNTVTVELTRAAPLDLTALERNFGVTSACGVCGKTSIEAVMARRGRRPGSGPRVTKDVLFSLPERLRLSQPAFERTGGIHAAALFETDGRLVLSREDVGRHNAVDKLVGARLLSGDLPLAERVLLLSGRASFELVQKAVTAGIAVVCAVGAPSSLAVELADEAGLTLVGFLREGRFNVYSAAHRIAA